MAKKRSKLDQKLDAFARVTFLDQDGKPKSTVWLYAFLLALLFSILGVAAYLGTGFLFGRIEQGGFWIVLLHAFTAAVVGNILPILLAVFLKGDRKAFVAYAFVWLAILFVMSLIFGFLLCDWAGGNGWIELITLGTIVFLPSFLSILIGGIPSWLLFRAYRRQRDEAKEEQTKSRPSYYNT